MGLRQRLLEKGGSGLWTQGRTQNVVLFDDSYDSDAMYDRCKYWLCLNIIEDCPDCKIDIYLINAIYYLIRQSRFRLENDVF